MQHGETIVRLRLLWCSGLHTLYIHSAIISSSIQENIQVIDNNQQHAESESEKLPVSLHRSTNHNEKAIVWIIITTRCVSVRREGSTTLCTNGKDNHKIISTMAADHRQEQEQETRT